MTVDTTGGGAVVPYSDDDLGFEDVTASDLVIPRINILHKEGLFQNNLTKKTFPALTVVLLGLVKQRIMWPEKLDDDDKPRCKSPDFVHGFPQLDKGLPRSKQFPWSASNFNPEDAIPREEEPDKRFPNGWNSNGHGTLLCSKCVFKEWSKDEDNKDVPPPCSEQHTYPMRYYTEDGTWVTALFTVQRSALKNSKTYINSFAQSKTPMFTVYTTLTLRQQERAGNAYCVPEFKEEGASDRNEWPEYGQQLRALREFIRSAPRPVEVEVEPSDNVNRGPEPESQVVVTDEVETVSTPAPAPAAPPASAPPPAPSPAPAPAPAAAAPPPPPAPPAPPKPPTPAASTPAESFEPSADDSDLPF